ncbi:hypothetical protein [Haliangium sp.]
MSGPGPGPLTSLTSLTSATSGPACDGDDTMPQFQSKPWANGK